MSFQQIQQFFSKKSSFAKAKIASVGSYLRKALSSVKKPFASQNRQNQNVELKVEFVLEFLKQHEALLHNLEDIAWYFGKKNSKKALKATTQSFKKLQAELFEAIPDILLQELLTLHMDHHKESLIGKILTGATVEEISNKSVKEKPSVMFITQASVIALTRLENSLRRCFALNIPLEVLLDVILPEAMTQDLDPIAKRQLDEHELKHLKSQEFRIAKKTKKFLEKAWAMFSSKTSPIH